MTTDSTTPNRNASPTQEQVWATLQRTADLLTDIQATIRAETAERIASMADLRASMKETDRRLRRTENTFNSQWGRLVESLVEGDLLPLLRQRNIDVQETSRRVGKRLPSGEQFEFDIVATNGVEAVVVEVKTTLRPKDVKRFTRKLSRFTEWLPLYRNHRIFGAMAYIRHDSDADMYAEKQGLFVIRATGKSASIVNGEEFKPRAFS